jgi:hypothetical protein
VNVALEANAFANCLADFDLVIITKIAVDLYTDKVFVYKKFKIRIV